ncbi:outer membrane porin GjpA [[Mycobacterium] kokjensenii]|uniref:Outer membrane porin GjpA n=1 Tax=[Mycobacterium] kokjensenii TaxID=3064287 RepID=A0ABN9N9E2_9MYCO|nr:outer membrane porin GjpA [Mycolicibacter sp. MU0083]CAJ1500847.1 outer membrane porin GjpA [Mycolicibacter sp. MU0083]
MQHLAPAPWVAAGIALVGAGTIAATPITATLPDLAAAQAPAVTLTAGLDLFGAWQDVFDAAKTNAEELWTVFDRNPFIAVQQMLVNQAAYQDGLSDGTLTNDDVLNAMQDNADAVGKAVTFFDADPEYIGGQLGYSAEVNHNMVFLALTGGAEFLGFPAPDEPIPTIVELLSSPLSGLLIGALGPSISPWVALANSFDGIGHALTGDDADLSAALQELINIPANMVGAWLNGATLDLSGLIPLINETGLVPLPEGAALDGLSFAFGGLLTPGDVIMTPSNLGMEHVGGSILNSLGLHVSNVPILGEMDAPATAVGPWGALESIGMIIAEQLGWDGIPNPLGWLDDGVDAGADLIG